MALEISPARGTRRDDIRPGLRTIGFERRATIAFRIVGREVVIIRIFYGGRDFERILHDSDEDYVGAVARMSDPPSLAAGATGRVA